MQVSWIDPEEVSALLRQIEGPRKGSNSSAWEIHTLPLAPQAEERGEPLMPDTAAPPECAEAPLEESRGGPPNAEIWRIRERLRVLRDKAQTAGILSLPPTEQPAPPPDPSPAVEPAAAAEEEPAPAPGQEPETVAENPAYPGEEAVVPEPVTLPEPAAIFTEKMEAPPAAEPAPHPPEEELAATYEPLFSPPSSATNKDTPAASPPPAEPTESPEPREPVPAKVPFVVSHLGLSERLNAVATWASERLGTHEVLLVDDYGDVLWGAQGQTALVLSAMMAWHAAQRASASATCTDPQRIDKTLGPDRALTVLPMRTRYGVVSLAVIQNQPVAEDDAAAIRDALALAVEGPGESRPV